MTSHLLPILLSLLAYVGWGVGDTISVRLFRKNNPSIITLSSGFYRILIWLILIPLFISEIKNITIIPFLFNLLAGLASGLGYYFFGKAAKVTNPSLVAAISGGWGVAALILSLIFLSEKITASQWIAILLVFVGLYLVTFSPKWVGNRRIFADKGVVYALLAFLVWGICGAFLKIPARSYGWYWTSVIMLIPYITVVLLETKNVKINQLFHINDYKLFLLMVVFTVLADLGYNGSLSLGGYVAITGTIAGSYATLSTFLTNLVYKEKMTKHQVVGVIISLIGIVLASYFTSIKT